MNLGFDNYSEVDKQLLAREKFLSKAYEKDVAWYWHLKHMRDHNPDRFEDHYADSLSGVKSFKETRKNVSTWTGGIPKGYFLWIKTRCKQAYIVYGRRKTDYPDAELPQSEDLKLPAFVVGCGKCEICEQEKLERKRRLWAARLAVMIPHWLNNHGSAHFTTLTVHDSDLPDEKELRSRFQRCIRALRHKHFPAEDLRYWMIIERGSKATQRLHIHTIFFLRDGYQWSDAWEIIRNYWKKHFTAWVHDTRPVDAGPGLAAYLTKYVSKALGSERIMSSQFGWKKFMEERQAEEFEAAGIPDGTTDWVILGTEAWQQAKEGKPMTKDDLIRAVTNSNVVGKLQTNVECKFPIGENIRIRYCHMETDDGWQDVSSLDLSDYNLALVPMAFHYGEDNPYKDRIKARLYHRVLFPSRRQSKPSRETIDSLGEAWNAAITTRRE